MSDYEGVGEHNILPAPPGKRVRKNRAKERKDNVDAVSTLPDGYATMMINGMEVLVKKPTKPISVPERKEIKAVTPPNSVVETTSKVKKPRAKTAWSEYVRLNGMISKKNTAAYNQFMEQYKQFKDAYNARQY